LKKNSKSAIKKEQKAKRAKALRPVQREPKEVLAELVEKLQGKLELGTAAESAEGLLVQLSPDARAGAEGEQTYRLAAASERQHEQSCASVFARSADPGPWARCRNRLATLLRVR